ncbi:FUSC family protein [Nesterenkonia muleiensis]|uniref:FUSC family protein n=1 Tax=Nesterenkonia muleiensis TaxID=2282648 RepID=UPI000E755C9C|nr:aromatic acid exporter family protein [Nesterenkonia muleiensis]
MNQSCGTAEPHENTGASAERTRNGPALLRGVGWLRQTVRKPEFLTDVLQILKTVIAATGAWWISVALLDSDLPFLAPWTALLTVHATVHRSLSRGVQTTVASSIGVGLSFVIGYFLGVSIWTFALALTVGLTAARISWIRDEGVAIATTAIFVLGSGFEEQAPLLDDRILEVGVGVAAGILVNLLIFPPLRDRQAGRYVDSVNRRMGKVLVSMAEEFSDSWDTDRAEAWFQETEAIGQELSSAWAVVRFARESRRVNPRGRLRTAFRGRQNLEQSSWNAQGASDEEILERADEGVSHLRHLARTLRESTYADGHWDDRFRRRWVKILEGVGCAIADPDAEVEPFHEDLTSLSAEMSEDDALPRDFWPTYGSLITSTRHIVLIIDDITSAREARGGSPEKPATSS